MIVLMWLALFGIPILLGAGIMTIVYQKNAPELIAFSDCFPLGLIAGIGVGEVSHIVGMFGNLTIDYTGRLFAVFMGGLAAVSMIAVSYLFISKKKIFAYQGLKSPHKGVVITFLVLFLLQSLFIFCMKAVVIPGDITLETVQSFLAENGIYRVMPLTGQISATGIPTRYRILCLPTIYAILAKGFSLEPELVICHIVPVIVLSGAYLTYFRLGVCLFGKAQTDKIYGFLLVVAVLFTCTEGAVFLDGYAALHGGYLGTSIRNLILVPYTCCAFLERRYWKGVFCILAEICITWTFWGLGVCLLLAMGILILDRIGNKIPLVAGLLQVFSEKEEQA